jgi:hypothetical protein
MRKQLFALSAAGLMLAGLIGCGAAMTGGRMGMNLARKDSHLKIWLDGVQAEQNKLKKAATGYSAWKIKATTTAPTLKFEIEDPAEFGRISMVAVSIYQKFQADYSHQAEYTIVARDTNDPQAQMRPGVEYNLASPGGGFKVLDLNGREVNGVNLTPGMEYMLTLTVRADHSETAQVYFKASQGHAATPTGGSTTHTSETTRP